MSKRRPYDTTPLPGGETLQGFIDRVICNKPSYYRDLAEWGWPEFPTPIEASYVVAPPSGDAVLRQVLSWECCK